MTADLRKAAEQALEALESMFDFTPDNKVKVAIVALRDALAEQPEPEFYLTRVPSSVAGTNAYVLETPITNARSTVTAGPPAHTDHGRSWDRTCPACVEPVTEYFWLCECVEQSPTGPWYIADDANLRRSACPITRDPWKAARFQSREVAVLLCNAAFAHDFMCRPVEHGFDAVAPPAQAAPVLTDADIAKIWDNLPGIRIHNTAAASGKDTAYAMRIAFARAILAAAVPPGFVVVPVALVDAAKQTLTMMIQCNTPFSSEYDEAMTALGDALAAVRLEAKP